MSSSSSSSSSEYGGATQSQEEAMIKSYGEKMTIQRRSETTGTAGNRIPAWTNYKTLWAWKQPMSSDTRIQYERREISVDAKIFVAETPSMSEGDRIVATGGTYYIHGVVNQAGLSRLWRLDVEEVK
jgi:SPP1 family predicted phage head-tail adaptor